MTARDAYVARVTDRCNVLAVSTTLLRAQRIEVDVTGFCGQLAGRAGRAASERSRGKV